MDEDWLLYFTTTFTFSVIFIFCYIRHVFTFFERNRIERATHPSFPFGNVSNVIFQKLPMTMLLWKFYNRFKKKKCRIGGFYIFVKPAIISIDPRLSQTILTKKENFDFHDENFDHWDTEFKRTLLSKICEDLHKTWPKLILNFKEEEEINFTDLLSQDYIGKVLEEFFSVEKSHWPKERSIFHNFKKLISLSYCQNVNNKYEGASKQIAEKMKDGKKDFAEVLRNFGFSDDEFQKFIICLISNLNKANNLVLFALFELSHNKEIQDDLRGEILRFRKNKAVSSYENLNELSYLESVICETLRKYPFRPFVYKKCKEECTESGVKLLKNTMVFVSIFGIHHDSQNYVNPELFDPDRFSEENLKFIEVAKYFPFGGKPSDVFDVLYVKLLVKIALVELLARFKFSVGKKSPRMVQFDETQFDVLKMKEDVWLKINTL